jgi:hypothetical protein
MCPGEGDPDQEEGGTRHEQMIPGWPGHWEPGSKLLCREHKLRQPLFSALKKSADFALLKSVRDTHKRDPAPLPTASPRLSLSLTHLYPIKHTTSPLGHRELSSPETGFIFHKPSAKAVGLKCPDQPSFHG